MAQRLNCQISEKLVLSSYMSTSSPTNQPSVIRFGLSAIKNVGTNVVKVIIQERKKNGKFKSIEDFVSRIKSKDLNKKSLESLIKCGALDQFGEREKLLANVDQLLSFKKNQEKNLLSRQTSLFKLLPEDEAPKLQLRQGPEPDKKTRLAWEKELLGLYVSEHPLKSMELYLGNNTTQIKELNNRENPNNQHEIQIVGIITKIQRVYTRNNEPMLFVKVEDLTGSIEVLVFPSLLKTTNNLWQEDKIISIKGRLSDRDDVLKILVNNAKEIMGHGTRNKEHGNIRVLKNENMKTDLERSKETSRGGLILRSPKGDEEEGPTREPVIEKTLQITLPFSITQDQMKSLKNLLAIHPGQNKVYLLFLDNNRTRKINTNFSVKADKKLTQEIEKIIGPNSLSLRGSPMNIGPTKQSR